MNKVMITRGIIGILALTTASLSARPIVNGARPKKGGQDDMRATMFASTCEPASASADLDINNVRTKLLNGGDMWWDLNNPKYEVPKVTDPNAVRKHSLFSGAIWIGGRDNGGSLKLAAMTYRQRGSDFWPGPLDTTTASTDPIRCKSYNRMWKVTRTELEEFEESKYITQSADIREWPAGRSRAVMSGSEARYLAPFRDIDGDGEYEPDLGEHPVLDERRGIDVEKNGVKKQPDQFIWWVYNDRGNIHSETQGQPIGVECQTTAFAFTTNDEVNNMTFYTTKIINRGFTALNDCYMGQWVDADLGNYADDYVGCDVGRSLGYCYNGDDDDEGVLGYGLNPPTVGVDYFEGPTDTAGNQMGLSHFMYYNNDNDPIRGNPELAPEFYNLMQGKWLGGQTVTRGGTGFGGSLPAKYMFPANTDPDFTGSCWDEKSSGNKPGDRRFIQSTGPFLLKPGQVQRITVGVVWARTTSGGAGSPCLGTGSLRLLQLASDKAQGLFNNNFDILDGPDAPDVEIQELNQELVLKLLNTSGPNVEAYEQRYKDANNVSRTYKFEGYLIYQLKDATVNTGDLENIDKARLLFQCDVKNNRAQIINKVYDPKLATLIPVEKVDGADKGITHSYSIKTDLFATGSNTQLVDFKPYYYMVLSYAILADDTLQIDPTQFLAGRLNIKTYRAVPHKNDPENFGTDLKSQYGSGPKLTQIEGRGNGGNVLEFSKETIDEILKNGVSSTPTYVGGKGPVTVKVVDPLKVPKAEFELYFKERSPSSNAGIKDSITKNTYWVLVNKTSGDTISSDTTIGQRYEVLQGRRFEYPGQGPIKFRRFNNANPDVTLADWGLSVEIHQVFNPGENATLEPLNAYLTSEVTWEDNGKQWLTAVTDNDAQSTPTSGAIWTNWIRSGTNGRGSTFDGFTHDFFRNTAPNDDPLDPGQGWERLWNGRIAPYGLTARAAFASGRNTYGFAWSGSGVLDNPLSELASVQIVITKDRSKWTRCVVLEMSDDEVVNLNQGAVPKFSARSGTSLDRNLNPTNGTGLSWFPGYAINLETGERLNMAFSEDSYLPGENGTDMIYNPTDKVFNDNGNYPAIGGKHFIYVFGTGYSWPNRNQKGDRYYGDDDAAYSGILSDLSKTAPAISKRRRLGQIMYVIPSYMAAGYSMKDGVPPTDVKFTINVQKAYATFNSPSVNNSRPFYRFNTNDIAPVISKEHGKKSLDLVNVVPNPYRAYSEYQNSPVDSRVKITNLPPTCTITIYDMAGNFIRKINKADERTYVEWDLKNGSNVPIASGLYLIHVKAPGLGEKIVRWYGIMQAIDLDSY